MGLKIKKQIYDNVHGYIGLTEEEIKVIDTPIFQRLRYIKQLGPTYLVYPGATHTRFAHSIGTMFMMDLFLKNAVKAEVSDEDTEKLRLAALLHDIGHYPFSHTLEYTAVDKFGGKNHESFSAELIEKFLGESLENHRVDEITRIISGKGKKEFGMLLSSALDADKSDYMLRDSYNTGVPYGKVGITSLLRIITFEKDKIIFEKDESPIENFLLGRYHLYKTVIHHKTAAGFNILLQRIFEFLVDDSYLRNPSKLTNEDEILRYTDDAVMEAMHSYLAKGRDPAKKEMIRMFLGRIPMELGYSSAELLNGKDSSPERSLIKKIASNKSTKDELATNAEIDPEWIFPVNLKDLGFIEESAEIYIRRKEGLIPIAEGNALILNMLLGKVLHDSRIYTKKGYGKRVKEAFLKMA
jgi:HD superfamily phosphohydrolase